MTTAYYRDLLAKVKKLNPIWFKLFGGNKHWILKSRLDNLYLIKLTYRGSYMLGLHSKTCIYRVNEIQKNLLIGEELDNQFKTFRETVEFIKNRGLEGWKSRDPF